MSVKIKKPAGDAPAGSKSILYILLYLQGER